MERETRNQSTETQKRNFSGYWLLVSGFSLIEVVLALGILIIGLVAIVLLFPVGLRASREAGILSEATLLAQSRIEQIKTLGYDRLQEKQGSQGTFGWSTIEEEVTPDGVNDPSKLKKISVVVTWTQAGKERKETFVTMVRE